MTADADISIRRAQGPADRAAIRELAHRIWPAHYAPIIGRAQVDYMLAHGYTPTALAAAEEAGTVFYLAEQAGQALGYAALATESAPATMLLDKLYLDASARGQGIGRRLLAYLIDAARAAGARRLTLRVNRHNTASIAFYKRAGFVIVAEHAKAIGHGYVMDDYLMTMALTGRSR